MASINFRLPVLPSRSDGDTLSSVNIYSDQPSADTLLGTMTAAEASAGKAITVPDGSVHSVTAKGVYATAGESSTATVALSVDTSTASWADFSSVVLGVNMTDNTDNTFTDSAGSGTLDGRAYQNVPLTGDFEFRILWDNNVADPVEGNGRNNLMGLDAAQDATLGFTALDYVAYRTSSTLLIASNGVGETASNGLPTEESANTGDEFLRLKRVGSNIYLYYDNGGVETLVHQYTTQFSGTLYAYIAAGVGFTVRYPQTK